jgi:glycosyltransferase involved in cell wall biosynthesis
METNSTHISIVVTAHAEGILIHKTLRSILRSLEALESHHISWEVILHCDSIDEQTEHYLLVNKDFLKRFRIYKNSYGNPSDSRNFAVKNASGKYVTFIDGDDLISANWLIEAYRTLESKPFGKYVAHTAMTVEFGEENSIVQKYGEIDPPTDTLLSVFAGRWNVNIFAPRELLLRYPYKVNGAGFGYEDWGLSCEFINNDIHNILIPETVLFVRRMITGSVWAREKSSYAVLPANKLLSFGHIRKLSLSGSEDSKGVELPKRTLAQQAKRVAGPILQKAPIAEKVARRSYATLRNIKIRKDLQSQRNLTLIPSWLQKECMDMHEIDRSIFMDSAILAGMPIYHTITPDHYRVGEAYWRLVQRTRYDSYDYILFVPWLVEGGADMFAINYANYVSRLSHDKRVLVVATNPHAKSPWKDKLDEDIDFIPFGLIAGTLPLDQQYRLLEQLVENSGANVLHILNSALGYDFIYSHRNYIKGSNKKVIATSYSQSTDSTGRVFGFSHTHVPKVYDILDFITTDNQAVIDVWRDEYGFDPEKMILHHQPFDIAKYSSRTQRQARDNRQQFKVLWAARLAPEKLPELVPEIGRLVKDENILIDMYGKPGEGFDTSFINKLPSNVQYRGPFNGLLSLPLRDYDAFLYTSLFDGTPNTLIEIGASRIPVVASATGGIPGLIKHMHTGLLIDDIHDAADYAAALKLIAKDQDVATELSANLHNQVSRDFGIDQFETSIKTLAKKISY